MKTATIDYGVPMTHWPPDSYLVRVDPPVARFHQLTGEQIDSFEYLAVQIPRSEMAETEAFVYPATEIGEFVDTTFAPILKWPGSVLHSVLKSMGYDVTN